MRNRFLGRRKRIVELAASRKTVAGENCLRSNCIKPRRDRINTISGKYRHCDRPDPIDRKQDRDRLDRHRQMDRDCVSFPEPFGSQACRTSFDKAEEFGVGGSSDVAVLAFADHCGLVFHLIRLPAVKTHRRDVEARRRNADALVRNRRFLRREVLFVLRTQCGRGRPRSVQCGRGDLRFVRAAIRPFFRSRAKACLYRIVDNIVKGSYKMLLVPYVSVKVVWLPNGALPSQKLVYPVTRYALYRLHYLRKAVSFRLPQQQMSVVGHYHPTDQATGLAVFGQNYLLDDFRDILSFQDAFADAAIEIIFNSFAIFI